MSNVILENKVYAMEFLNLTEIECLEDMFT